MRTALRRLPPFLIVPATVVACWLTPTVASACTCSGGAQLVHPQPGTRDVPIDTALRIQGYFDPDLVVLEREDGTEVAAELRDHPTGQTCVGSVGELLPSEDLEPHTVYVVRLTDSGGEPVEARFETGSSRVPELPLEVPEVTASFVEGGRVASMCGTQVRSCIALSGAEQYEVTLIERGSEHVFFTRSSSLDLALDLPTFPTCVRVRARDDAGRYSQPVELCDDQITRRWAVESDFDDDLALRCVRGVIGDDPPGGAEPDAGPAAHDGGAEPEAGPAAHDGRGTGDGGCQIAAPLGASPTLAWPLAALLFLTRMLAGARRRRWPESPRKLG